MIATLYSCCYCRESSQEWFQGFLISLQKSFKLCVCHLHVFTCDMSPRRSMAMHEHFRGLPGQRGLVSVWWHVTPT